jgi:type I restriction enzyme R subunit
LGSSEDEARREIDLLLAAAGWAVCDLKDANITAARGVAIREFKLKTGHGYADYLLYVDGKAAGVIEAKKHGVTLTGVETQSAKYVVGLPNSLPAWNRPLPFSYQSTGVETRFTNGLDPEPRSRATFAFHRPETLAAWLTASTDPLPALVDQQRIALEVDRHVSLIRAIGDEVDTPFKRGHAFRTATLTRCFRTRPRIEDYSSL